jgi:hypothetical protein
VPKIKKAKKLSIVSDIVKFEIPSTNGQLGISQEHIKTSYKGGQYDNLCVFSIRVSNVGLAAIADQRLHILIPEEAKIVEVFEQKSLESINRKRLVNDTFTTSIELSILIAST